MQSAWHHEHSIFMVGKLLEAGANPDILNRIYFNIPGADSEIIADDTAFRLAIRSQKPELIDAICSVLFQKNSLESLYNIIVLTIESLKSKALHTKR